MTSLIARLPPALLFHGRQTLFGTPQKYPISFPAGKLSHSFVAVKATGESSESSTSLIVKSVQNVWDKSEDRFALFGFGFAAVVAIWASANLITAIDKLPLIPNALELVGILFSSWFVYRYLLFKPDREELSQIINRYISDILGQ
ncbi:protein CURVATURE THYLAKOID 1C, chloroplastic isoform X2 [Malania oleifera]|uniref:protein CURVATURE THYLAKOID 1C, chloroplastic isoform X2 n=1 Tax=Malania oleifera TaxID=397392 RepID=UPI0025AE0266|nr:protein CURVATURE THYLAKOID 1C, chloroplastic isoform X2 [Malania oleifera]